MFKSHHKLALSLIVAGLTTAVSATAQAALVVDIRVAGTGAKTATVALGSTVNLEIYATVTGSDADLGNERFTRSQLSILSTGGIRGNFTSALAVAPFADTSHQDTNGPLTITPVDLDADGDLDIGSNNDASVNGFFRATSDVSPFGTSFLIGTATFLATDLTPNIPTSVNVRLRTNITGSAWVEDGLGKTTSSGIQSAGAPVLISAAAIPEPAALAPLSAAPLALLRRRRA